MLRYQLKFLIAKIHWDFLAWKNQTEPTSFWSNYSDLTRPGPPNGGLEREILLCQGNLGLWNII